MGRRRRVKEDKKMTAIMIWLAAFLTSLTPNLSDDYKNGRTIEEAQQLAIEARHEVAMEIAEVAYDENERPLYAGPIGRAHTAALLASIAGFESRLRPRIRMGHCLPGECDQGKAVSAWQLHTGEFGLALTEHGYRYCARASDGCDGPAELIAHEKLAVRYALRKLRLNGLSSYTGEGWNGPVTQLRRDEALKWVRERRPPMNDAEVARAEIAAE
jgi:hypothetical protein